MTRLLALDSSAGACSVAVVDAGRLLSAARIVMDRGHAEALMPLVERAMAESGLEWDRLQAVAATVGPGSFTGVRIGLAAARGIALARRLPTVPVTTLEAVAEAVGPGKGALLAVVDSKRQELYGQWFRPDGAPVGAPCAAMADALLAARPADGPAVRVAGDAVARLLAGPADSAVTLQPAGDAGPDARAVAAVALRRLAGSGPAPLTPLYLRAPDVTLPPGVSGT